MPLKLDIPSGSAQQYLGTWPYHISPRSLPRTACTSSVQYRHRRDQPGKKDTQEYRKQFEQTGKPYVHSVQLERDDVQLETARNCLECHLHRGPSIVQSWHALEHGRATGQHDVFRRVCQILHERFSSVELVMTAISAWIAGKCISQRGANKAMNTSTTQRRAETHSSSYGHIRRPARTESIGSDRPGGIGSWTP